MRNSRRRWGQRVGLGPDRACQKDGSSKYMKDSSRKTPLETETSEEITAINLTKTVET